MKNVLNWALNWMIPYITTLANTFAIVSLIFGIANDIPILNAGLLILSITAILTAVERILSEEEDETMSFFMQWSIDFIFAPIMLIIYTIHIIRSIFERSKNNVK